MSLHHAIVTLKTDSKESPGDVEEFVAHVEKLDALHLRIYGTTQQISELFESLLENNNLGALHIYPLEKIPDAETGSGD